MERKQTVKAGDDCEEMRREYEFRGGVRGKYAERYRRSAGIVSNEGSDDGTQPSSRLLVEVRFFAPPE
jgi:hypothetical protein